MSLSNINSTTYQLSYLTGQISDSVKNIQTKAISVPTVALPTTAEQRAFEISLNSYAVSYLEPQSLYQIHKFLAETAPSKENQSKFHLQQQENPQDNAKIEPQSPEALDFYDELSITSSVYDYAQATAFYKTPWVTHSPSAQWIFGAGSETNSLNYVTNTYNKIAELNETKLPLIEFLHKNNRNFDYKV